MGQPCVRGREVIEDSWRELTHYFDRKRPALQRRSHSRLPLVPRKIIVSGMAESEQKQWFFYLARCSDGSLYSGIAVDPARRMDVHNAGKGARYTRSRLPVVMVYSEPLPDQSSALKREAAVRKWSRQQKEALIAEHSEEDT